MHLSRPRFLSFFFRFLSNIAAAMIQDVMFRLAQILFKLPPIVIETIINVLLQFIQTKLTESGSVEMT